MLYAAVVVQQLVYLYNKYSKVYGTPDRYWLCRSATREFQESLGGFRQQTG